MRCRYCGTELGSDADFCPNCGTPTGQQNMVPDDTPTCVASNYGLDDPGENTVNINPDDEPPTTQLNDDGPYYGSSTTFINGNGYSNDYGGGSYSGNQQNGYNGYSGGSSNYSTGGNSYSNGGSRYSSGSYSGGNNSYYQPPESGPDYGNDYKTDVIQEVPPYSPGRYPQSSGNAPKKKKTWIIWTIVAVLVVALLGGGGWFFLSQKDKGETVAVDSGEKESFNIDTTGYVQADQEFIDFSDFYNGYALVTYYRVEGDPSTLTASLINKKGELCPIKDGNRTINGLSLTKYIQIFPVQKSGLLLFCESDTVNPATGTRDSRMIAIDNKRNMVSLNEKGYTFDDFVGTGEECILMRKRSADRTAVTAFNLLDMSGELIKSFEVKAELQKESWKIDARCAVGGKYFILKSDKGNKYIISKDSAQLVNSREETFPAAEDGDELAALLDCQKIREGKYKTIILTTKGEVKEVVGNTDYSQAGAVYEGRFFIPSSTEQFTGCSIVSLSDGSLKNTQLKFKSNFDSKGKDNILCGFSGDYTYITVQRKLSDNAKADWYTYQFGPDGTQIGSEIKGYLTHVLNIAQREVYYLNQPDSYKLRFFDPGEPVVIQSGNTSSFYSNSGAKIFTSEKYQYVYQFSNDTARAATTSLKNGEDGYTQDKSIDYANPDSIYTFSQKEIVYLDSDGQRLFNSIKFPSNY